MIPAIEAVYICAGLLLPLYYWPQIVACARDRSLLASYSMSKAATQLALRATMLPFVFQVGNPTMNFIVSLDAVGRMAELAAAVSSLRRQGLSWRAVISRCAPTSIPLHSHRFEAPPQPARLQLPAPADSDAAEAAANPLPGNSDGPA